MFIQTSRISMKGQISKKKAFLKYVILVDTLRTYNFCCINFVKIIFFDLYLKNLGGKLLFVALLAKPMSFLNKNSSNFITNIF